jgi:hypothetical protein
MYIKSLRDVIGAATHKNLSLQPQAHLSSLLVMYAYMPAPILPVRNFMCETMSSTPAPCSLDMGTLAGPIMAPNYVFPQSNGTMGFAVQWTPGAVSSACAASVTSMNACNDAVTRGMFAGVTPLVGSTPGVLETVMPGDVAFYAQVARNMQAWTNSGSGSQQQY